MRTPPAAGSEDGDALVDVRPLTPERLPDLADLFVTTAMTGRCHCTYFLLGTSDRQRIWRQGGARACFEEFAQAAPAPVGVLAYRGGRAVGWCAAAPRANYPVALRSPLYRERDPDEDASVWFASCFYVHRSARHQGLTRDLVEGAVGVAAAAGATAIEGLPRANGDRVGALDVYVGAESVFAATGFDVVRRPSPRRVLMRRDLDPP
jgi:GNAT superfamily N-acetyltransferase